MTSYLQLMKVLPLLVSILVWDVINDRIDELTIKLAQATSKEEIERYDPAPRVTAIAKNLPATAKAWSGRITNQN